MKEKIEIQLRINDQPVSEMVFPELTLADFLHEKRGLTGTKVSCGIGVCKACTVAARRPGQFNLERIQACVMPVAALNGYDILTVEGLASSQSLSLQQQSFLNHFSFQCGYCAPGFLMGVTLLIDELKRKPVKRESLDKRIEESIGQHICRCTGYAKYYQAIHAIIAETPGLVI
jgi:aerobic-type carbon monoxide dehydrogenase small subunit (CoxS/CutS family)